MSKVEINKVPFIWIIPNIYKYKSTFTAQCVKSDYNNYMIAYTFKTKHCFIDAIVDYASELP